MKKITSWHFLCALLLSALTHLRGQSTDWQVIPTNELSGADERRILPDKFTVYQVDTTALRQILDPVVHEREARPQESTYEISLPDPDGNWQTFQLVAYDLLHPLLQEQWTFIKTWRGISTNDPTLSIRLDWTARGFHAMVLAGADTWFIDPYYWNRNEFYQVYYKKDYPVPLEPFECLTEDNRKDDFRAPAPTGRAGDCQLREYDLALACTGEYATYHGGTVAGAASAFATTMNRVNGVYEEDLALRLVLVANNNDLIYLDGATDPYTNNSGPDMLGENQTNCDAVIGNGNYDIGHVFSTGGGGIASLRSPCTVSFKARGVTGLPNPVGDPFDIDYVTHEMGHQFGGNHTQNNPCNRSSASMEPGSASTIMGYAGICSPNVQSNSDPYYHAINILEIANYMELGGGNSCATIIDMSNSEPSVTAGQNYDIPGATPFVLTGSATDPDGDPITYCWEQFDNEVGEDMPPLPTNTQGPMFRSFTPTSAPERYFPRLTDIINNVDPAWETLPETNRTMDFRLTIRDFNGTYGCNTETDVTLTVDASAGPFLVTNPNTNISWYEGSQATVNWDVAGTNGGAISCSNVDILLSTDGGMTYSALLLNTPNDGTQNITVPSGPSTTARVMVRCTANVFFDISNTNFTIEPATAPDYTFSYSMGPLSACEGSNTALDFIVNSASIAGYNDPLTLSTTSTPLGVNVSFSSNPINPGDNVTVTVSNFSSLPDGNYLVSIESNSTAGTKTVDLPFELLTLPAAAALASPNDGSSDTELFPLFDWSNVAAADSYLLEIAEDINFNTIVFSVNTNNTEYQLTEALEGETDYFWQVTSQNTQCGLGMNSATWQFATETCYYYENSNTLLISSGGAADYVSTIDIPNGGDITDIDLLNLDITHTWVGDLRVQLTAPGGTITRTMFSYDCGSNDDVSLSFDDEAGSTLLCPYNTGDKVQPDEALSAFDNQSLSGTWTLTVRDNANLDGGSLNNWGLRICTDNFTVLPVEWVSFTAKNQAAEILLDWVTTREENNAGFDLERRTDYESAFKPIAWIPATEQPVDLNTYVYQDKDVQAGLTYYYRLRQIDYSGSESYSEIRSARLPSTNPQWTYYPNPASDKMQLRFWNTTASVQLRLVDTRGRTLRQWQVVPEELQTIELSTLPSGIYWLKANTPNWNATEKIVVH